MFANINKVPHSRKPHAGIAILGCWVVLLFSLPGASAEKVWEVLKDFGDATWLVMVDSSTAENGNEPGSVRSLVLGDGSKVVEKLKSYDADKMSYKYRIPDATHDVAILPRLPK